MKITEVVAALIWDEEKKIMICQRPRHKKRGLLWEFVGGKVEAGESREDALKREIMEEIGVDVCINDMFCDVTHEYSDVIVHITFFNANITNGVPKKIEHNDIKWVTVDEMRNYEFCPADESVLNLIQKTMK